jgi:TRAP-type C4-dicarboxylate transport system permease small subunit
VKRVPESGANAIPSPRARGEGRGEGRTRRALDALYAASGALAAVFLAATCVVMLLQVAGRELRILFRGADDITAWLTAASVFFALGHTFRKGELVRVGLLIDRLPRRLRWWSEVFALGVTLLFAGYAVWAVTTFVYESWKLKGLRRA